MPYFLEVAYQFSPIVNAFFLSASSIIIQQSSKRHAENFVGTLCCIPWVLSLSMIYRFDRGIAETAGPLSERWEIDSSFWVWVLVLGCLGAFSSFLRFRAIALRSSTDTVVISTSSIFLVLVFSSILSIRSPTMEEVGAAAIVIAGIVVFGHSRYQGEIPFVKLSTWYPYASALVTAITSILIQFATQTYAVALLAAWICVPWSVGLVVISLLDFWNSKRNGGNLDRWKFNRSLLLWSLLLGIISALLGLFRYKSISSYSSLGNEIVAVLSIFFVLIANWGIELRRRKWHFRGMFQNTFGIALGIGIVVFGITIYGLVRLSQDHPQEYRELIGILL